VTAGLGQFPFSCTLAAPKAIAELGGESNTWTGKPEDQRGLSHPRQA